MKIAFIASTSVAKYLLDTHYYLALPWTIAYYSRRNRRGDYLILDNGAAEGRKQPPVDYMRLILKYKPHEVVLPDKLKNSQATETLTNTFIREYKRDLHGTALMGVVQGVDHKEFISHLHTLAKNDHVTALGVPRHMPDTVGNKWARALLLEYIYRKGMDSNFPAGIHCLGANSWIREVRVLAEFPIRGMDTSLPVTAALAHKDIRDIADRVERDQNFFDRHELTPTTVGFIIANQRAYLGWANGTA